ncbi:MAG TPA: substrate-binding domain-containing protein, partial [Anaeromyxobacteraceae bacterium]
AVDNDLGDPDLQNALVTADNRSIGRSIGLFMKEVMGGVGDIVEIRGIANRSTKDRSDGFREAIAGHPRMRIIDTCSADWSYDLARQAFEAVLLRRPRIDAVFAQNDEMARGALDAAAAFGRELEMLVTGVDAVPGALGIQLVSQGRLAASCLNPPLGKQAALGLLAVLDGEPFQKVTVLQTSMLRSNERIRAWQATHQS